MELLTSKIAYFTGKIEQTLEETLGELLSNNLRMHPTSPESLLRNEIIDTAENIKELAISLNISAKADNKRFLLIKKNDKNEQSFKDIDKLVAYVENMKVIYKATGLIRLNIDKIYKYPIFTRQTYIPDLIIAVSSLFKKILNSFFLFSQENKAVETVVVKSIKTNPNFNDFKKISNLCRKSLNELSIDNGDENSEISIEMVQIVYYAAIISNLELIALAALNIDFEAN